MPRGDGTGPTGKGPRSGRGAGNCRGNDQPERSRPTRGRGVGRTRGGDSDRGGRGAGRGFGAGRGRGPGLDGADTRPLAPDEKTPAGSPDDDVDDKLRRIDAELTVVREILDRGGLARSG